MGDINNAVIKLLIYFNLHMGTVRLIMESLLSDFIFIYIQYHCIVSLHILFFFGKYTEDHPSINICKLSTCCDVVPTNSGTRSWLPIYCMISLAFYRYLIK